MSPPSLIKTKPAAAVLKLWLEEDVLIEVLETVDPLEFTDDVDEFEPRNPPRVNDFSLSCCVLVVATMGLGPAELGCTVSRRGVNKLGFGAILGGVRWVLPLPFNEVLEA